WRGPRASWWGTFARARIIWPARGFFNSPKWPVGVFCSRRTACLPRRPNRLRANILARTRCAARACMKDIAEWLTSIGLGEYAQPFRGKPHRCERPARSDGSGSRKNRHPAADQAGNIYYARRRVNEDFLAALHKEFLKNGARILRRAGEESPATFLKVLAQLVPRELQMEHSGTILSKLSDEQLGAMITELERQIADH